MSISEYTEQLHQKKKSEAFINFKKAIKYLLGEVKERVGEESTGNQQQVL